LVVGSDETGYVASVPVVIGAVSNVVFIGVEDGLDVEVVLALADAVVMTDDAIDMAQLYNIHCQSSISTYG
jgi:hypothetical protein